ncbi:MAG TPA: MCE family protein [Jatrophihabitantaceae bacterium]|jgi:phospholipid/cholesterol/gamma-HCH transport system substrate-binding protein|nr:MCE family protein [Jatrophihabitantaceae bacterium]
MAIRNLPAALTRSIVVVVVLAAVAGVAYYLLWSAPTRKVTAYFSAAVGVYPGTDVDILGIKVGSVTKVTPEAGDVKIEMKYESRYEVPANASAFIIPPGLVSDRYLQLAPAYTSGAVMANDASIPMSRTLAPVELDDVYAALNTLSSALGPNGANKDGALSDLVNVAAANLKGNGAALGTSISDLSEAAKTLADGKDNLFDTVTNLNAFAAQLVKSDSAIQSFNTQLDQVSGQLAGERQSLAAALANLSSALTKVAAFVRQNQAAFHTTVVGLENVTGVLVKDKGALNEVLHVAPTGIDDLVRAYNPAGGAIDVRTNLSTLASPTAVCSLLNLLPSLTGISELSLATKPVQVACESVAAALGGGLLSIPGLSSVVAPFLNVLNSVFPITTLPGVPTS